MTALLAVPMAIRTPAQQRRIMELSDEVDAEALSSHLGRRKRKKRSKKNLSQGVSSRGRARRRHRQWHVPGWSVFLSVDDCPQMLSIMAVMDQKDSIPRLWCAHCRLRQRHVQGWFYRLCSSRCIPSSCRHAKMLGILAGVDQKDIYSVLVVVTAVVCAWLVFLVPMLSRCLFFDCRQARVARHHGAPGQGCSLPVQIYVLVQFLNKVVTRPLRPWSLHRCIGHFDKFHGSDSTNCLEVPQLQLIFTDVGAKAALHGPGEIPYSWWSMSLLCSSTSCRGAGAFSHGQTVRRTTEIPQLLDMVIEEDACAEPPGW